MSERQILGLIIGGVAGFVVSLAVFSPRWRYFSGGYIYTEDGASDLGGCALEIFMTSLGGLFGVLVGGLL